MGTWEQRMALVKRLLGNDRSAIAERSNHLACFLEMFGLHETAELATGDGAWLIAPNEDEQAQEFAPDRDEYLETLSSLALRPYLALTFPGTWRASGRRVWLEVEWDEAEGIWCYIFPGEDDDAALDGECYPDERKKD